MQQVNPPSYLNDDKVTNKWTDDGSMDGRTHRIIMLHLHTPTMWGSDVASLVEFRQVV